MAGSGWDSSVVGAGVQVNADGTAERLDAGGGGTYAGIRGLAGRAKGKRYFEVSGLNSTCSIGIVDESADVDNTIGSGAIPSQWGLWLEYGFIYYRDTGNNGNQIVDDSSTLTAVVGVLMDFDNKKVIFYEDGVEVYEFAMSFADDMVLYPATSMGVGSYGIELQTVEPFEYPPEVSFIAWDLSDLALSSRVSGTMKIDGVNKSRTIKAFSYSRENFSITGKPVTESMPLGQTVSDEQGDYSIFLRDGYQRQVFLVAFDDYGNDFTPDLPVSVGYRIHPTTPNGYVYECNGSGTLPSTEPSWVNDTESSQSVGTASFVAVPFYMPQAHGPVIPTVELVSDPHYENVVLLLHCDGVAGSSSFVDHSSNNSAVSAVGGTNITVSWAKFGQSAYFDGSGDGLIIAAGAVGEFDSADFTFETTVYSDDPAKTQVIATNRPLSGANGFMLMLQGGKLRLFAYNIANALRFDIYSDSDVQPGDDIAFTVESGVWRIFINGFLEATAPASGTYNPGAGDFRIGSFPNASASDFLGKIDEIRLTEGVCRYNSNYVPSAIPFPES